MSEERIRELKRIFKIWDLTLLSREDPKDVVKLEDVAGEIQDYLGILGYYKGEVTGRFDEETKRALERFMMINNFENKMRDDGYLWGSIFRYLKEMAKKRLRNT